MIDTYYAISDDKFYLKIYSADVLFLLGLPRWWILLKSFSDDKFFLTIFSDNRFFLTIFSDDVRSFLRWQISHEKLSQMRKMGGREQHFGVLTKLAKFFNGTRISHAAAKITVDYNNLEKILDVPDKIQGHPEKHLLRSLWITDVNDNIY